MDIINGRNSKDPNSQLWEVWAPGLGLVWSNREQQRVSGFRFEFGKYKKRGVELSARGMKCMYVKLSPTIEIGRLFRITYLRKASQDKPKRQLQNFGSAGWILTNKFG
jgi:hypothetical protein